MTTSAYAHVLVSRKKLWYYKFKMGAIKQRGGATINIDAIFKALADPLRRRILEVLHNPQYYCKNSEGTVNGICVQDIARYLTLPQSTVSRHLAILSQSGLISQSRHRTWHYYSINKEAMGEAIDWIHNVMPQEDKLDLSSLPPTYE